MTLRTPINDEGCDVECKYCGTVLRTGQCRGCGYVRECDGCQQPATRFLWNEGPVFLCQPCEDLAFEQQTDDANTP